jgi:hypothetical protein
VNDQAGERRGQWVALREAVFLDKEIQGPVGTMEETLVGGLVHKVEVVYNAMESSFGLNFRKSYFA